MKLGTLLVHLDHTDRCAARVKLASWLAKTHGSYLIGLLPTDPHSDVIPQGLILAEGAGVIAESAEQLHQRVESVAQAFTEQMAETDLRSFELRMFEGQSVDAVIRHGRASDLVIVGQDDPEAASTSLTHELAGQVLTRLGRPLLVVPYAGAFEEVGKQVLVAWDASREAAVALRDALPLLGKDARVTLASFGPVSKIETPDGFHAAGIQQWLSRHGVPARVEQHVADTSIADALLSRVTDLDADLIVMGGYAHAPMRERLLGGVTREVLAHMTVPVLMAH